MSEADARALVVSIARQWIGTPYRHGARIKNVAADCTFFAKVYEEAALVPAIPIKPYLSNAHLNRASGQYLLRIKEYARETKTPQPGDIAMFHIARDFSHGGIISDHGWPWIIHANMAAGLVLEERGDQAQLAKSKEVKFFTLWG